VASGNQVQGYAASLITMGEGVALQAYEDPAKGAGRNIGMGYNLKANAATVDQDLKQAKVPAERIEGVKNGTVQLTPDQAVRLLKLTLPRYEKQVRNTAEAAAPGLWDTKLTQREKAVMIDVAYQVGSTDQFKKAWAAAARGDMQAFADEVKVSYTDHSGQRREDTRRNNLRASMLAGLAHWDAVLDRFGSLPSDKLQAAALASK
jgi:GH24 family phage-related lysozyme (muramidase)